MRRRFKEGLYLLSILENLVRHSDILAKHNTHLIVAIVEEVDP